MSEPTIDVEFFPIFEGATELVAKQLAYFRDEGASEPTENEKLMAGHIVGGLCANGYTQLPGTVERLRAALACSVTAIDDWLNIYASEHCDAQRVAEAEKRVYEHGTLYYIATVQEQNRAALGVQQRADDTPK